jgi:hypothetical protein
VTAGLVWLVAPWGTGIGVEGPGHTIPRHVPHNEVVVWTGEVAPGLKGVLGPVWGDPKPDRFHDASLNKDLGLEGERALVYYRLLVFNTTEEARSLDLGEGRIVMLGETEGGKLPLRSLAKMVERKEISLDGGLEFSLRSLGALTTRVEVPAGSFAKLVVPFDGKARIETARAVATKDGTELRRRQIAQGAFRRLVEKPDESQVKDL